AFYADRLPGVTLVFAIRADAAANPLAERLDFAVVALFAGRHFAAGAHYREERLNAVNAIPVQIGMRTFETGRACCFRVRYFTKRALDDSLSVLAIAERR